jgi:hypothetical protein
VDGFHSTGIQLKGREQERFIEPSLGGETGEMAGDLLGHSLRSTHVGPSGDAITRRARLPISAERRTLASATTAFGSEIVHDL